MQKTGKCFTPIYEAIVRWLRKPGGWLAGEIWLKSAGLHHKSVADYPA